MTKNIKRNFALVAIVSFLFEFIFQVGGSVLISYGSDIYKNESFSMMVAAGLSLLAGFLLLGFESHPEMKHKKFNLLTLLWLLLFVNGLQFLISILNAPLLDLIYDQGYSMQSARDVATGTDISGFWSITYAVIGAPVIEECFCRGIIYGRLRKYGKIFAITITAFLFGLLHCNLIQFFTAVGIGILFAWIRETYGLRYSILVHSCNNIMAFNFNAFVPESTVTYILLYVLFYGGILVAIISLIVHFKRMEAAFKAEPELGRMYYLWFTTIPVIFLTVILIILTALSIFD
ncbi:CAAX amino terminal protease family [Lachnospiraceae bacterium JC7]|nr:CAAX amino terminal protease family [Lachnospiraceae bacterium JC7]